MAWTTISLPGGATAYGAWHAAGRWVVGGEAPNLYVSSDLDSFVATTLPGSSAAIVAVASDGARLYAVTYSAFYRSTDGLIGATWEAVSVSTLFPVVYEWGVTAHWLAAVGARLVAVYNEWISTSDDGGETWTVVHTLPSSSGYYEYGRIESSGDVIAVANGGTHIGLSLDGGETWASVDTGLPAARTVAVTPAGIAVSHSDYLQPLFSIDNGASWSAIAGYPEDKYLLASAGDHAYLLRATYGNPRLYHSQNFVDWTAIDTTGGPTYVDWVSIGGGLASAGGDLDQIYITETPAEAVPGGAPITLPLRLTVGAISPVRLPLRLQVGQTGAAIDLPVRLRVISDAATGGLGGASGWPAAPDGKWLPVVTLDGVELTALTGPVTVAHADNEARTASFAFRPAAALQPMGLTGRRVQIAFAQRAADGSAINAQLMFSGVIDVPSVDALTGVVSCECHDQMQEIITKLPTPVLDAAIGGRWRAEVSGEAADGWEYVNARILSVPKSMALDELQGLRVVPWRGAGLRTATIRDADYLDGSLSISLPSRDELRTRITCRMQYRYERLRGRGVLAQFSRPLSFYVYKIFDRIYSRLWLTRAMVMSACEGVSGWTLSSPVQIETPRPQLITTGGIEGGGYVITKQAAESYLALGFKASYSTRWQQTVTEDYTITLVNSDLEDAIGPIPEEIGATLQSAFEARNWESDDSVAPAVSIPAVGDVILPWRAASAGESDRDEIQRTLLDQAWCRLYDSTRSGRIELDLPLRPDIWLDWWVTLEVARVRAAGKVVAFEHVMSPDGGSATTSVAMAVSLPGSSDAALPTWTLPAAPADPYVAPVSAYSFEIESFVGGQFASPPFDEVTMIGFSTNEENIESGIETLNWYPHQLSMRPPDVAAEERDPRTLSVETVIPTAIPSDTLEIL